MNLSRVAAKQLTASDLTFFAALFHRRTHGSKQKAINLNADVFVAQFYPGLRDILREVHFGLTIVGPGASPPYSLTRKITRTAGGKNWRLDGELVSDPPDQAGRFDVLAEGDVAILAFEGVEQPEQAVLVLISQSADADLHAGVNAIAQFQGRESMRVLNEEQVRDLIDRTRGRYPLIHPLQALLSSESVEEAIYGSSEVQEAAVRSDGRGIAISPESVRRQAITAGETGQLGEEVFHRWLASLGCTEDDFEWVSRTHGRAAFDFEIRRAPWEAYAGPLYLDVKSTRGVQESSFHMSSAELRWAARHASYRIARISGLTATSATIRILGEVSEAASRIIGSMEASLPAGVKVDSIEMPPALLTEVHSATFEWNPEE